MCVYEKNLSQTDNAEKSMTCIDKVIYGVNDSPFMNQGGLSNVYGFRYVCGHVGVYIPQTHI